MSSTPSGSFVYDPSMVLGSGGEGTVFKGERVGGGAVAVKVCREKRGPLHEMEVLSTFSHPNVMPKPLALEEGRDGTVYLVMDLFEGGDLHAETDRVFDARGGLGVEEGVGKRWIGNMLKAVAHVHTRGYAHLDLKLENWLLGGERGSGEGGRRGVVLADFGFAAPSSLPVRQIMRGPFTAPETRPNGPRKPWDGQLADIWGLGVCFAALLTGYVAEVDRKGFVRFGPNFSRISRGAQRFIRRILQVRPKRRPSLWQIAADPWLGWSKDEVDQIRDSLVSSHSSTPSSPTPTSPTSSSSSSSSAAAAAAVASTSSSSSSAASVVFLKQREGGAASGGGRGGGGEEVWGGEVRQQPQQQQQQQQHTAWLLQAGSDTAKVAATVVANATRKKDGVEEEGWLASASAAATKRIPSPSASSHSSPLPLPLTAPSPTPSSPRSTSPEPWVSERPSAASTSAADTVRTRA